MTTVVLDANVLASGFVRSNPAAIPMQVVDARRRGAFDLVVSDPLLTEVIRAFRTSYFRRHLSPAQASRAAALLRYQATRTPITVQVEGIATHPEDDLIMATAVSAQVTHLISGDEKLQKLRTYQGVTIISPREFLEFLRAGEAQ